MMRRTPLEAWEPLEKMCLAEAVRKNGDQNWSVVSRVTRQIYEDVTKMFQLCGVLIRSPDWFSMKQCAAQYGNLLETLVTPVRKKRGQGNVDVGIPDYEIILDHERQEMVQYFHLKTLEMQREYLNLLERNKEIDNASEERLIQMYEDYEHGLAREREREIKLKLKMKIGERNLDTDVSAEEHSTPNIMEQEIAKSTGVVVHPTGTTSITSPLLTSLLQSPSPLNRQPSSTSTSPTISHLLESPTLSKLLESPTPSLPNEPPLAVPLSEIEPTIQNLTPDIKQVYLEVDKKVFTMNLEDKPKITTEDLIAMETDDVIIHINDSDVLDGTSLTEKIEIPNSIDIKKEQKNIEEDKGSKTTITNDNQNKEDQLIDEIEKVLVTEEINKEPVNIQEIEKEKTAKSLGKNDELISKEKLTKVPKEVESDLILTEEVILDEEDMKVVKGKKCDKIQLDKKKKETEFTINKSDKIFQESEILTEIDHTLDSSVDTKSEINNKSNIDFSTIKKEEMTNLEKTVKDQTEKIEITINVESCSGEEIDMETLNDANREEKRNLDSEKEVIIENDNIKEGTPTSDEITSTGTEEKEELTEITIEEATLNKGLNDVGDEQEEDEEIEDSTVKVDDENETVELDKETLDLEPYQEIKTYSTFTVPEVNKPLIISVKTDNAHTSENYTNNLDKVYKTETNNSRKYGQEFQKTNVDNNEKDEMKHSDKGDIKDSDQDDDKDSEQSSDSEKLSDDEKFESCEDTEPRSHEIIEVDHSNFEGNVTVDDRDDEEENDDDLAEVDDVEQKTEIVIQNEDVESVDDEDKDEEEDVEDEEVISEITQSDIIDKKEEVEKDDSEDEETDDKLISTTLENDVDEEKEETKSTNEEEEKLEVELVSTEDDIIAVEHPSSELMEIQSEEMIQTELSENDEYEEVKEEDIEVIKEELVENVIEEHSYTVNEQQKDDEINDEESNVEKEEKEKDYEERENIEVEKEEMKLSFKKIEPKKEVEILEEIPKGIFKRKLSKSSDSKAGSPAPTDDTKEHRAWKKSILLFNTQFASHRFASIFLKPITEADAPGYHEAIKRPMDLHTLKRLVECGTIRTTVEYQLAIMQMVTNALVYNSNQSELFPMIKDLATEYISILNQMVEVLDGIPLPSTNIIKLVPNQSRSKQQTQQSDNNSRRRSSVQLERTRNEGREGSREGSARRSLVRNAQLASQKASSPSTVREKEAVKRRDRDKSSTPTVDKELRSLKRKRESESQQLRSKRRRRDSS